MEKSWSQELLKKTEILHLATLKEDGAPILRPVNFVYWENKVYIHTGPRSGKIEQIRRDPRVCFEIEQVIKYIPAVDKPCSATYSCRSILGEGQARLITDKERKRLILNKMMEKYQPEGGYRPVSIEDTDMIAVIEVEIQNLSEKDHIRI